MCCLKGFRLVKKDCLIYNKNPFPLLEVKYKLKPNETTAQFIQKGLEFATDVEYAGGTVVLKLFTNKSDEKSVVLNEQYRGALGLYITVKLGENPEHLEFSSLGDYSDSIAYVNGNKEQLPEELGLVLDYFINLGMDVQYNNQSVINYEDYNYIGGHDNRL